MRKMLVPLVVALALFAAPAAMADTVDAGGFATGGGMAWSWSASYDTVAHTLTFQCDLVNSDTGQPVAPTQTMVATVKLIQSNNQTRTADCVQFMNLGVQTIPVTLKIANSGRWSGFLVQTNFVP
jgi:hypothetical protein